MSVQTEAMTVMIDVMGAGFVPPDKADMGKSTRQEKPMSTPRRYPCRYQMALVCSGQRFEQAATCHGGSPSTKLPVCDPRSRRLQRPARFSESLARATMT